MKTRTKAASCKEYDGNNKNLNESNSEKRFLKIDSVVERDSRKTNYDSLFASIECDDGQLEIKTKQEEDKIDSLLSSLLSNLHKSNKDTMLINPLIELLTAEQKTYKSNIAASANLIYWSYGVSSMTGERIVARKCYYLRELQKKFSFYLSVNNKIKGSLLNL